MNRRGTLWFVVALLSLMLVACGDDTGKRGTNNDNGVTGDAANNTTPADAGNNTPNADNADAGNNDPGDDVGNNDPGDDVGNNDPGDMGGDDTGGDDTGGDDMGGDDMGGDDMSDAVCGNGMVEEGEDCDDGNQSADDNCNPDCTFTCGDGTVGANETCDTAIPPGEDGACPADCDDQDSCTTDTLQGAECQAECVHGDITACDDGDLCCPAMCNANTDDDCMAMCGNDVVEGAELCDGDCPATEADCDDMDACTADSVVGDASTCDAMCVNDDITACVDDDGCCPPTCDSTNDNDCSASCGNDVVEAGETCDGDCPTSDADCDDSDMCTTDAVVGSAANCTATCENDPVACDLNNSDGCCPVGCDSTTDVDCTAVCGNSVVETGEQCDDGNTVDGDGCDANCQSEATTFRMSDLDLMDPHVYVELPLFGCSDITNDVPFDLAPAINDLIQDAIQCDGACGDAGDDDGLLDLSFLATFRPLDQTDQLMGNMSISSADCTAPMSSTACTVDPTTHVVEDTTYSNDASNDCLGVIAGTDRPYTPAIQESTAPCFSSATIDLTIDIGGILIPLTDVQFGATYVGNPATSLSDGLLRGFLSEASADMILLPDDIDLVGGTPLSMHLPGGDPPDTNDPCMDDDDCTAAGETCEGTNPNNLTCQTLPNCAGHDDKDTNGGTSGWWFYLNFPADEVPLTEL